MRVAMVVVLWLVCAAPVLAEPTAAAAELSAASADRADKTAAGTTFTAPAGWARREVAGLIELTSPESDLRLALVEVDAATDGEDAAAKAWRAWAPDRAP